MNCNDICNIGDYLSIYLDALSYHINGNCQRNLLLYCINNNIDKTIQTIALIVMFPWHDTRHEEWYSRSMGSCSTFLLGPNPSSSSSLSLSSSASELDQVSHRDPPRLGSLSRLTVAGTPAVRTSRGTSASRPWRQSSACCTSLSAPSQSAWPRPPSASPGTVSSRVHCC